MYLSPETLTILICLDLILLALLITFDLAISSLNSPKKIDADRFPYLDSDGNHSYYERSLIEKIEYRKAHPEIPLAHLRTFSRLISLLF